MNWPNAIAQAAAALNEAAKWFEFYASEHAKKEPTFFNQMKCSTNLSLLANMRNALKQLEEEGAVQLVAIDNPGVPRPLAEWHEDMGDCLWWKFPITEPPYVGSPLDNGSVGTLTASGLGFEEGDQVALKLGGWPGYHTHFTRITMPKLPES